MARARNPSSCDPMPPIEANFTSRRRDTRGYVCSRTTLTGAFANSPRGKKKKKKHNVLLTDRAGDVTFSPSCLRILLRSDDDAAGSMEKNPTERVTGERLRDHHVVISRATPRSKN